MRANMVVSSTIDDIKPNTAPCLDDDSSSAWLSSTSCADLASLGWCTTGDYISQTSQRCPESCSLFTHIPACTAAAIKSVQMRANMVVSSTIDDIKPNTAPCLDDDSSSAWLSSPS